MLPKFDNTEDGQLVCPSCGFNCLHHDKVEVFECTEDATHGVHVTVSDGKAVMDTSLEGNPSARRHGLSVHFWCEGCDAKPVLSISQHKGCTYMTFE